MNDLAFRIQGLKLILGGCLILGLAITQLIFGWMGNSVLYRYIYPVVLCLIAALFFYMGKLAAFGNHDLAGEETTAGDDTESGEAIR